MDHCAHNSLKVELEAMTSRVEQVTEENTRLHSELRKNLESQIEVATKGTAVKGVVDSLQKELEMAFKERDSLQNMLKKTSQELQIMQRSEQVLFYF